MVDVNTQNKTISVNVSSSGVSSNVNASGDTTMYYSNKAREWAISNRIVDGVDYSSKYYAGRANQSALNAQSFAQSAIAEIENLSEQEQNKIIDLGIDTRADVDLSNLSDIGEKHFLNKTQITNCLLEVPQRVKLELNDGVLTLKAGSQVIVPNGFEADGITPKFDYVTVENDLVAEGQSYTYTGNVFVIANPNTTSLLTERSEIMSSGTTPSNYDQYGIWYDTTTNKVKRTNDNGSTWYDGLALPIGICYYNNAIQSISQTFNGFGYIGSTVWVDKGVKGLIPNGRNEDGTLRNIEYEFSTIKLYTELTSRTGTENIILAFDKDGRINVYTNYYSQEEQPTTLYTCWYKPSENNFYVCGDSNSFLLASIVQFADYTSSNLQVKTLNPKQPFRAVDWSDSSEVAGWGMPANKYIDLTLGASGSTYTAPANGWIYLDKVVGSDWHYCNLINLTSGYSDLRDSYRTTPATPMIPVRKGDVIQINYNATGETNAFRFYYAEGEV